MLSSYWTSKHEDYFLWLAKSCVKQHLGMALVQVHLKVHVNLISMSALFCERDWHFFVCAQKTGKARARFINTTQYPCRNLSSSLSVNFKQSRTQFCKELQIPDVISGSKLSQRINWITPMFQNKDVTVVFINCGQGAPQICFKCKVSAAADEKKDLVQRPMSQLILFSQFSSTKLKVMQTSQAHSNKTSVLRMPPYVPCAAVWAMLHLQSRI